jgi:hypothetical protein
MKSLIIFDDSADKQSKPKWNPAHTVLSKYVVTRLFQLVDIEEVITYRTPINNGIILLEEIYEVAKLCQEGSIRFDNLYELIQEATNKDFSFSLINDPVIHCFYRKVIDFYKGIAAKNKKEIIDSIKTIQTNAFIHVTTIRRNYTYKVCELIENKLDTTPNGFFSAFNNPPNLDHILIALIAQSLRNGNSITNLKISFQNLVNIQAYKPEKNSSFSKFICQRLSTICGDKEITNTYFLEQPLLEEGFQKKLCAKQANHEGKSGYEFTTTGKDVTSAFVKAVTSAFRTLSLTKQELSFDVMNVFWESTYAINAIKSQKDVSEEDNSEGDYSEEKRKIKKLNFDQEPLVRKYRPQTLNYSLRKILRLEDKDNPLEKLYDNKLDDLEDSLYLYNLALNVPSLENSYLLLWIALESLMGLKGQTSDIKNIQDNVAQALALGAVGRRANATVQRLRLTYDIFQTAGMNQWKDKTFAPDDKPYTSEYHPLGLCEWIEWICRKEDTPNGDTHMQIDRPPYRDFNQEPVLAKQYLDLHGDAANRIKGWKTLGDLREILLSSEKKTKYQLSRLYRARNEIVHIGRFNSTYPYLWLHLEWYVGKLLATAILSINEFSGINGNYKDIVFAALRGQYEATSEFLQNHSSNPIQASLVYQSGLTQYPVLCF